MRARACQKRPGRSSSSSEGSDPWTRCDLPRLGWSVRGNSSCLGLVCFSHWAFGAVESWAELALELGIAVLAVLAIAVGWRSGRNPHLLCLPSIALLGLIGLALFQATPLPGSRLRSIAPATTEARAALAPAIGRTRAGRQRWPVAPPAPTLSENREETVRAATRLTAAWVLFQAVLELGGGYAALRRLGLALAGNAVLLALFSMIQALSWNGKIYWVRPSPTWSEWSSGGPFVGHSPLAAELNLGLGFALAFLLTPSHQRRFRPWAAYVSSVIAVGVVASHSRTGFTAMALALIRDCHAAAARAGIGRDAGLGIGLLAMAVLIPLLLVAMGQSSPLNRIGTIAETSSYSPRLEIWRRGLEAWRHRPLLGSGLGTFATATAPYFTRDEGVVYTRAENEYLDLLVEGGVLGLALMALFLGALARSGRDALSGARTPRDRFVVTGALFGILTLAIHSLSDFALHIPAVAVAAVVLAARVCRLGSDARAPVAAPIRGRGRAFSWAVAGLATVVPITLVLIQGVSLARAEVTMARTGLPLPGSAMPEAQAGDRLAPDLELRRAALAAALADRPDWAEGHLRLGLTYISLYRAQAQDWLADATSRPEQAAMLASPLWLHGIVHTRGDQAPSETGSIVDQEPIRGNLVPATRCFLEARRCCPTLALPHAELAQLDYLIEGGEPVSAHAARALRLGRASAKVLAMAAQAALQAGDIDLAPAAAGDAAAGRAPGGMGRDRRRGGRGPPARDDPDPRAHPGERSEPRLLRRPALRRARRRRRRYVDVRRSAAGSCAWSRSCRLPHVTPALPRAERCIPARSPRACRQARGSAPGTAADGGGAAAGAHAKRLAAAVHRLADRVGRPRRGAPPRPRGIAPRAWGLAIHAGAGGRRRGAGAGGLAP